MRKRQRELIEQGDLYFFYRPKVHEERERTLEDVERFYLVMAPDEPQHFRLLIVGQKYLPEILPGRMVPSERDWAIVDYVTDDGALLTRDKLSWEETVAGRPIYPARPAGIASYQLFQHEDHTELAYALLAPEHPGPVQETFNILPEASYIVKVKNPEHIRKGKPGAGEYPEYPQALRELFDESWINVKDARLLDYEKTQLLLMGAHQRDIEQELGIQLERESAATAVSRLYRILHLDPDDHPRKPLVEGQWPESKKAA